LLLQIAYFAYTTVKTIVMTPIRSGYRWTVVSLLFFATTINYIDRQIISLLKDDLGKEFNWNEAIYSYIVIAFNSAYALGNVLFGMIIDRIGTKKGYSFSIVLWSIAAMFHGVVRSTFGFYIARGALGLGESGNFPSAIKTVAEWFPKKERALATGIFNSGTNVGPVIVPGIIYWISHEYSWRAAFIVTGLLGFIWLIFWLLLYEIPTKKKKVNPAELAYIQSDAPEIILSDEKKIKWVRLLGIRQTWAFVLGKFFTDPVWWFYLFWIPTYFNSRYHIDLRTSWVYVTVIYGITTVGSVLGGYLPGFLIGKGWSIYRARKTSMFIYALCVMPVFLVQFTSGVWATVLLISLATSAHQAWSANIFTTASDVFPKSTLSSVIGLGTMAGAVGSIIFPLLIGAILDHFKLLGKITAGYNIIFIICSCAYIIAWVVMHFLTRKKVAGI